jgi:phosphatidylserine decarboxylase
MDVHVNRLPVSGRVTAVKYHPGRFLPAYRSDAGELNEFTEVTIDHGGRTVVVRQIVGILARRIVCRVNEGDVVKAGDRFGVMKFGSRMDVFLPLTATVQAKVGDKVVGGETVLAMMPDVRSDSRAETARASLVH